MHDIRKYAVRFGRVKNDIFIDQVYNVPVLHVAKSKRVTDEALVAETAVWPIHFLFIFIVFKGSIFPAKMFVILQNGNSSLVRLHVAKDTHFTILVLELRTVPLLSNII